MYMQAYESSIVIDHSLILSILVYHTSTLLPTLPCLTYIRLWSHAAWLALLEPFLP